MEEIATSPTQNYAKFRKALLIFLLFTPLFVLMPRLYANPGIHSVILTYAPFYIISRGVIDQGLTLWVGAAAAELAVLFAAWILGKRKSLWATVAMAVYALDTALFLVYNIGLLRQGVPGGFMTVLIGLLIRALYFFVFYLGWTSSRVGVMTDDEMIAAGEAPEVAFGLTARGGDRGGFARFERDELVLIRAMGTGKGNFVLKRVPYGDILRLAFDPENNEWITIRLKTPGEPPEIKFSKKENRDRFLRLMSLHGIVHRSLQNAGPDKAE